LLKLYKQNDNITGIVEQGRQLLANEVDRLLAFLVKQNERKRKK
jgi:hypothetical protein